VEQRSALLSAVPLVLPSLLKGNRGRVAIGTIKMLVTCSAPTARMSSFPRNIVQTLLRRPSRLPRRQGRDTAMKWAIG
jgi:hypothetical protein